MARLTSVEALEISKNEGCSLRRRFEVLAIHAFGFEFSPDTVQRGGIQAIVSRRETNLDTQACKDGLILGPGVVSAWVRMTQ